MSFSSLIHPIKGGVDTRSVSPRLVLQPQTSSAGAPDVKRTPVSALRTGVL